MDRKITENYSLESIQKIFLRFTNIYNSYKLLFAVSFLKKSLYTGILTKDDFIIIPATPVSFKEFIHNSVKSA